MRKPKKFVMRDYIEELVKMFGLTQEEWDRLNRLAEEPTDKLYKEEQEKNRILNNDK